MSPPMLAACVASLLLLGPPDPSEDEQAEGVPAQEVQAPSKPAYADVLEPLPEDQRDEKAARKLMESGKAAFVDQRYEEAIEFLAEAYRLFPQVKLLYSLGSTHRRAYENTGEIEHRSLSIRRYRQYLSAAPDAEYADLAQNYLTALLAERDLGDIEQEAVTRILVSTAIEEATMVLDGGPPLSAPGVIKVDPGDHELLVRAPGYHDSLRRFEVPEGTTYQVQAELEPIDGRIWITGPKAAVVHIEGDYAGQLPLTDPVFVVPGAHVVTVSKNGFETFSKDIEVERDGAARIHANLRVSNQRFGSYFLMGIGAGGLVGSAVFFGLSVNRQQRARKLADKRATDLLTTDEYAQYVDLVDQRTRLRAGGVIMGIAGALVLVTGGVLFAYDIPDQAAMGRDLARVRVAPLFGPEATGIAASLRF